jgi:hypothetical protein
MNKPAVVVPVIIIINACIWGFTMIMCAHTLRGTGAYQEIQNILAAGTIVSLVTVGGGLGGVVKMLKSDE